MMRIEMEENRLNNNERENKCSYRSRYIAQVLPDLYIFIEFME